MELQDAYMTNYHVVHSYIFKAQQKNLFSVFHILFKPYVRSGVPIHTTQLRAIFEQGRTIGVLFRAIKHPLLSVLPDIKDLLPVRDDDRGRYRRSRYRNK